jgi:hypothetical protein
MRLMLSVSSNSTTNTSIIVEYVSLVFNVSQDTIDITLSQAARRLLQNLLTVDIKYNSPAEAVAAQNNLNVTVPHLIFLLEQIGISASLAQPAELIYPRDDSVAAQAPTSAPSSSSSILYISIGAGVGCLLLTGIIVTIVLVTRRTQVPKDDDMYLDDPDFSLNSQFTFIKTTGWLAAENQTHPKRNLKKDLFCK